MPYDDREYVICKGYNTKVILYQLDLLKIINALQRMNNLTLANKLIRCIFIKDFNEGVISDIKRNKLPKIDLASHVMSPKEYLQYKINQKNTDLKIREYYDKRNFD